MKKNFLYDFWILFLATGPYIERIFGVEFGVGASDLMNINPLPDFGGEFVKNFKIFLNFI